MGNPVQTGMGMSEKKDLMSETGRPFPPGPVKDPKRTAETFSQTPLSLKC
jgi:hypothetical protein